MASIGGSSTPDQTGNKRQNSVTSQRNVVNISPLPPSDASMSKRNNSLNHNPVTKQESSQSANSQGSSGSSQIQEAKKAATAPMTRMSSTIMGQDNGASAAVQVTKLSGKYIGFFIIVELKRSSYYYTSRQVSANAHIIYPHHCQRLCA
uniref:Uncharacterized protein n=1 Tax=Biomphalaria glabrata TaxID=6526 RepID=A0A2C9KIQ5_BIOGL